MTAVLLRTYNANRTLLPERGLTPGWAALKTFTATICPNKEYIYPWEALLRHKCPIFQYYLKSTGRAVHV